MRRVGMALGMLCSGIASRGHADDRGGSAGRGGGGMTCLLPAALTMRTCKSGIGAASAAGIYANETGWWRHVQCE